MRLYLMNKDNTILNLNKSIKLEKQYSCFSTNDAKLIYSENGKPYLMNDSHISFNISHKNDLWGCVFGDGDPVGLDIESLNGNIDQWDLIAKRFFHKKECDMVLKNKNYFVIIWSAKESFVKCTGKGIQGDFSSFSVIEDDNLVSHIGNYYFCYIVFRDYFISICTLSMKKEK